MASDDPERSSFSRYLAHRIHERREDLTRAWVEALEERIGVDEECVLPSEDLLNEVPALIGRIAGCVAGADQTFLDPETRKEVSRIASLRRRQGFGVEELMREYEMLAELLQAEAEASAASYEGRADLGDVAAAVGRLRGAAHELGTQTARSYRAYALRYERENSRLLATYGEMLSHELGNRLGAAETAIKLLRSDMVLSDQQRNRLEELILEGIERGLQAVQDVRMLAGPEEADVGGDDSDHRISLRLLMKESVRQAKVRAAKGDVRLELSSDLPDVRVPAAAVRLVLANLVGNAVKYHHPEGDDRWVKVAAAREGDSVRIEVEDNGPGIPDDERSLVFEQRYRGDEEEEGSGLGLAIAGDAVARLHGDIWVEEGEAGGARFVFLLPLGEDSAPTSAE